MAARPRFRLLLVLLLSLGVFASACSSSNDPETWGEAQEDGTLRPNFIRACTEANADGGEVELTEAQAQAYCECAFIEIVEYFGGDINADNELVDVADATAGRDFAAFRDFENGLRNDPQTIPADIQVMLTGCAEQAA